MTVARLSWNGISIKHLAQEADQEMILAVLTDFYARLAKDVLVGFFFDGRDPTLIAKKQAEFIEHRLGRGDYTGRSPASAHRDLPPILAGHFARRLVILKETLSDTGLSSQATNEWLAFEELFASQVVKPDLRH